jgi:hypothetical protein
MEESKRDEAFGFPLSNFSPANLANDCHELQRICSVDNKLSASSNGGGRVWRPIDDFSFSLAASSPNSELLAAESANPAAFFALLFFACISNLSPLRLRNFRDLPVGLMSSEGENCSTALLVEELFETSSTAQRASQRPESSSPAPKGHTFTQAIMQNSMVIFMIYNLSSNKEKYTGTDSSQHHLQHNIISLTIIFTLIDFLFISNSNSRACDGASVSWTFPSLNMLAF